MLQVGRRARVLNITREAPDNEKRATLVGTEGLLVRRLNVPWTPDLGSLWELRLDDGTVEVFSESELEMIGPSGEPVPQELDELREAWDKAPRTASMPFRRFGGGSGAAPAVLALVLLCVAGILLIWAGLATGTLLMAAGGGVLILLGIGAVAVLVA